MGGGEVEESSGPRDGRPEEGEAEEGDPGGDEPLEELVEQALAGTQVEEVETEQPAPGVEPVEDTGTDGAAEPNPEDREEGRRASEGVEVPESTDGGGHEPEPEPEPEDETESPQEPVAEYGGEPPVSGDGPTPEGGDGAEIAEDAREVPHPSRLRDRPEGAPDVERAPREAREADRRRLRELAASASGGRKFQPPSERRLRSRSTSTLRAAVVEAQPEEARLSRAEMAQIEDALAAAKAIVGVRRGRLEAQDRTAIRSLRSEVHASIGNSPRQALRSGLELTNLLLKTVRDKLKPW